MVAPGTTGGVEWNGPAYDPVTRLLYVGSVDWCWYFFSGEVKYEPMASYMGVAKTFKAAAERSGWVYAVDGSNGNPVWKYHTASPVLSGVTPTRGGTLISGESSGNLLLFGFAHREAAVSTQSRGLPGRRGDHVRCCRETVCRDHRRQHIALGVVVPGVIARRA